MQLALLNLSPNCTKHFLRAIQQASHRNHSAKLTKERNALLYHPGKPRLLQNCCLRGTWQVQRSRSFLRSNQHTAQHHIEEPPRKATKGQLAWCATATAVQIPREKTPPSKRRSSYTTRMGPSRSKTAVSRTSSNSALPGLGLHHEQILPCLT